MPAAATADTWRPARPVLRQHFQKARKILARHRRELLKPVAALRNGGRDASLIEVGVSQERSQEIRAMIRSCFLALCRCFMMSIEGIHYV